jgi:L-threonylcarbamoyladenylate synthase
MVAGAQHEFLTTIGTDIDVAAQLILKGDLVAIPTETVYGLAANGLNEKAVEKIFLAKNRPSTNPLILHVAHVDQLKELVKELPALAIELLEKFAPGPLTLLLPKKANVPTIVNNNLPDIAVRIPDHSLTLALLQKVGVPLAAPSANPFGYISPTAPLHVKNMLEGKIEYILDGGICASGLESTIVGFPEGVPSIYRLGMITQEDIEQLIGPVELNKSLKTVAPGMLKSHYSPNTPLLVSEDIGFYIEKFKQEKVGVITYNSLVEGLDSQHQLLLCENNEFSNAAKKLYAALHDIDKKGYDIILVRKFPAFGIGNTLNDRLLRAAVKNN